MSKPVTMAPRRLAVAIAWSPATPAPRTRTLAGRIVPAAVVSSGPGLELLHPLAVTMLGGLVTLLLVQGFLLPALLLPRPDRTAVSQGGSQPVPQPAGRRYRVRVRRTAHTERP